MADRKLPACSTKTAARLSGMWLSILLVQVLVDITAAASSGRADGVRQQCHNGIGTKEIDTITMGRP